MNYYPISVLLGGNRKAILQRLKGNGIVTVLDFLKFKRQKLHERLISQKMLPNDIDSLFNEIDSEIANLRDVEQLLINQISNQSLKIEQKYLTIGEYQVISLKEISIILGDIGSGKTTLLFQIIQQYLNEQEMDANILYFDCTNTLQAKRIFQILKCNYSEQTVMEIMSKIHYKNFDNLKDFETAIKSLQNNQIVFIDGLLTLFSECEMEIYNLYHNINDLMRNLYQLTDSQQNTFVITIRSIQEPLQQLQGTKYDQYINQFVSTIIHLINTKQTKIMKIHKSSNQDLPFDSSILYQIQENGIIWQKNK